MMQPTGKLFIAASLLAILPCIESAMAQTTAAQSESSTREVAPSTQSSEERIADLQAQLQRQIRIADNARMQMEQMRQDVALKDELIALAVERNAQLYEIATELVEQGLSKRSLEVFVQAQRVKMENLKQDYEDRLRNARFYQSTLPPSVQRQMDEDLAKPRSEEEGGS